MSQNPPEDAESQTNIFQHKWALTADTAQNPVARALGQHAAPGREVGRRANARRTHRVLALLSLSRGAFPFHQGKAQVGSQCRAGEKKQGGSPKQTASAAVRTIPSNPSWGLRAASSGSSRPPLRAFKVAAPLHPAAGYRESSASRGRPSRRAKPQAPTERQG